MPKGSQSGHAQDGSRQNTQHEVTVLTAYAVDVLWIGLLFGVSSELQASTARQPISRNGILKMRTGNRKTATVNDSYRGCAMRMHVNRFYFSGDISVLVCGHGSESPRAKRRRAVRTGAHDTALRARPFAVPGRLRSGDGVGQ